MSSSSRSSTVALLRLQNDMEELSYKSRRAKGTIVNIQKPHGEGDQIMFCCTVTPVEGPFAHGSFAFILQVPCAYPFSPPTVKCLNPVFHPDFDFRTGAVFLPILTHNSWRPVITMNTIIFSLQLLFVEHIYPKKDRRDTFLNSYAHRLRRESPERFVQLVRATMEGGHFFDEYWETTLKNGSDGSKSPIKSGRKRNYTTTERPLKRRRFGENISLSDLRHLSLSDPSSKTSKSTSLSSKLKCEMQTLTRKRSLDVEEDRSSFKRRKWPSSVQDGSPSSYLSSPYIFIDSEDEVKQTTVNQPVLMDEDS